MMGHEGPLQTKLFYTDFNLDRRVRQDHPLRPISRRIDFDFAYREVADPYGANGPAGKRLYKNGANVTIRGFAGVKFAAPLSACSPCALRHRCLRHPDKTKVRQVVFFKGRSAAGAESFTTKMKRKIDSALGKRIYPRRLATAEPPFANIRHAKGLDRLTLRGKTKVNAQWLLYCLVHNLGKIQRYGPGFAASG